MNRGTETAYDVTLTVPENTALDLRSSAYQGQIGLEGRVVILRGD
jgi:hypothetical protein